MDTSKIESFRFEHGDDYEYEIFYTKYSAP